MTKDQITKAVKQLETKEDLLKLLNHMKKAEMAEMGYSDLFHPFTMKQIVHYSNPNHNFHRYAKFFIPKKKKGEVREIDAPRNNTFKLLLHYVNEIFKAIYTPSNYAMGFTEGRSVVNNAEIHKGQRFILNIDLKDFFPSIEQRRLLKRIMAKPFGFNREIALILSGFCFMKTKRIVDEKERAFYVLPQGAPTSPIITNMICDRLDHFLAGLAKRFNLKYSRYADDITFSSNHYVYKRTGEFWKELTRIIIEQGFTFNDAKTRLQKKGMRQEVTGIIVSEKINVSREYVRNVRNILYIWDRYGYNEAYKKFLPLYKSDKGHVKKGNPDLINVIDGKLMYMKMVKGENDANYIRLHTKFQKLVASTIDESNTTTKGLTYLEILTVPEFENAYNTILKTYEKNGTDFAYFKQDGETVHVSINKAIKKGELVKENLKISHCRTKNGEHFWLLHKPNRNCIPPVKPVDIDELNNELDSLLNI